MKSEKLVRVMDGVDYLEVVTRRERRGSSQGVSVRVAWGVYYRPGTFRSRPIGREETVHADTGMLGLTTKHIHFAGSRKSEAGSGSGSGTTGLWTSTPLRTGSGSCGTPQTVRPQAFRAGDGWSAYNLAANLAQI